VRDVGGFDARPLPGTGGLLNRLFSPDSEWLGSFRQRQTQESRPAGGPAITVCDAARSRAAAPDSRRPHHLRAGPELAALVVSAEGGTPER
jgi:hypothetical protein